MEKQQFKAESQRLLDLMINSIYTHKEIFLREIISNASDAIDKLAYTALTDDKVGINRDEFAITITRDPENRTLTVSDNGIGMSKDEMIENLGTIAKSGSLGFKQAMEKNEDIDIIGQFGVGFYSAFMVASSITVISRKYGEDKAWKWVSDGADGYTVEETEKATPGTDVIMTLKADTEDEKYSEYLEEYEIRSLIRKYSDYIRYPIRMEVEKSRMKEQPEGEEADEEKAPEYETYTEVETLNSMVPIWRKNKNELTDEDYNSFYKEKFFDYSDPLKVIHTYTEGAATYHALLFIPAKAPYNYYTRDYEKGLKLYASGVLIMDSCKDLLPDHFSFVKGLVDSEDLSLNISREMLQHDRQLKVIASRLEKKIKSELLSMLKNDREKYEEFFKNFGLQLKYGVYNGFGANKELLQDLLLFYSSSEQKLVTLEEYVSRMKEDQKYIYYAGGESREQIERLPQTELVKDKGYEILYLTDDVDEFALQMMHDYSEKEFKSVSASDLDLDTEEEKKEFEKQTEENKDLLTFMKDALDGKVKAVVLSKRLKSHPVCLSNEGMLSIEMEKVLNAMPNDQKVKAERVLEVNASHPIFEKLSKLYAEDQEKLKTYAQLLYTQAELIEGMPVEDPVAFSNAVCELMV